MSELNNLDNLLTLVEINTIYNSNKPEEEAIFLLKKKCYELIEENRKIKERIAVAKKIIMPLFCAE
jgi:hypothetical protein